MQHDIENKAIGQPPHSKSEAKRLDIQAPLSEPQEFQFSGDGKKQPITIKAATREEAIAAYQDYLQTL
jgi:hypothetical protein